MPFVVYATHVPICFQTNYITFKCYSSGIWSDKNEPPLTSAWLMSALITEDYLAVKTFKDP